MNAVLILGLKLSLVALKTQTGLIRKKIIILSWHHGRMNVKAPMKKSKSKVSVFFSNKIVS